jgi:hypothetical protein
MAETQKKNQKNMSSTLLNGNLASNQKPTKKSYELMYSVFMSSTSQQVLRLLAYKQVIICTQHSPSITRSSRLEIPRLTGNLKCIKMFEESLHHIASQASRIPLHLLQICLINIHFNILLPVQSKLTI